MITVLSWLWNQPGVRSAYTADHVNIWAAMVRRYTTVDIEVACVTDTPDGIDKDIRIITPPREFEAVRIPTWQEHRPQCLRRIAMFREDAADIFGERFACMDLDCVISGSLDGLLGAKEDFRICKGTAKGRPYNGSFILMTAGSRSQVYNDFTPERAKEAGQKFLGSDQAWIAHCLPNEKTFGLDDGIMMSHGLRPAAGVVMFYPGAEKPWHIVRENADPWVLRHYRGEKKGRAIYLGYGSDVWTDAERAMQFPYGAVLASPEAAKHWPGQIKEIVRDDAQAVRVANMLGYDLTLCGAMERAA